MRLSLRYAGDARTGQLAAVALAAFALACTADITPNGAGPSAGGAAPAGSGGAPPSSSMPPTGYDPKTLDPGFVPMHRLTNGEYNNVVGDLLGSSLRPADFFQAQTGTGFDNNAGPLTGLTTEGALAYFNAAQAVAEDVFKNPALKAKVLTCAPAAAGDTACAESIIKTLGRRAFRRPLEPAELQQLVGRYSSAISALGKDHEGAIEHVLRVMLSSAPFLYWLEIDPNLQAAVADKRPLGGYELASRLSFALWGSLPDTALLDLAESGSLTDPVTLAKQVDRLLDDPKGPRFVDTFFNQWLHISNLGGHQVDAQLYPAWNEALRGAMFADAHAFFTGFVNGSHTWAEFLTAPLAADSPSMAGIYAGDPPGLRKGFLGLPAFLTAESVPTRTAPTFRGKVVLEAVMCTPITLPANLVIPDLDQAGAGADSSNIRVKLQAHRQSPDCAGCHNLLDPIGFGLEGFDAIGRYRTKYENGDPIDSSVTFQGQAFSGLEQLIPLLIGDDHYRSCPSEKLLSYALRRTVRTEEDKPYIDQLSASWQSGSLRELVKQLVLSDAFRFRKLPASAL